MSTRIRWGPAGLLLTACSSGIAHPPYVAQPQSALVEVDRPPPPGRVESVPSPPRHSAVWVDGEWVWRRDRWSWLIGRWVEVPPDARYSPWEFVRGADGRLWCAAGVWRDARGLPVESPSPLAVATVDSAEVVNASGTPEVTGRTRQSPSGTGVPSP